MSSVDKDERLLPLPNATDLHLAGQDGPSSYPPMYDDENFAESRSLREYFLVVYKKLPIILAMTILVTAVVAFYMYRLPSIYEATTTMVIEPRKPKAQSSNVYINFGEDINYYNTQLRLLRNPALMKDVVIRLGLHKNPNLFGGNDKGFISSLRSMVTGDKSTENKDSLPVLSGADEITDESSLTTEEKQRAEAYAANLVGGLSVEQVPSTSLINIKIVSGNPELAPKVSDMVAKVFIEQDAERSTQGAKSTYEDLTRSIDQLKGNITEKEQERLSQMQSSNIPLTAGKGQDLNAQRLQMLSTQFINAEDDRRKVQALYEAAVNAADKGEIMAVVGKDDTFLQDVRAQNEKARLDLQRRVDDIDKQISDAEAKRSELLVKYQEEYGAVKAVTALIARLNQTKQQIQSENEAKIKSESERLENNAQREILTGLRSKLAAAQRREIDLKAIYFREYGISNQQGQAEMRLTTLTSEIETYRAQLNTYVQRQKEMELTIKSNRPDNLTISSYAQNNAALIGPQRPRNVIVAFFLSLGVGIGLAFLLDYLDDSIKTSDDVGKHLGLPTLALIPHQSVLDRRKRNVDSLASQNGNASSTALIAIEDNRSAMAEAYRHLRTSLLFSSAGKPPQTILVTSSQPSEGKTTTAINTAITLAQSGADVVIIDCDLRRPRLHNHFGMSNTTGLTNYISGEKNPENLLESYPALPRLKVITSGPIPPNPAELLSSAEMKNLLTYLKANFNHIIIDSPPAISFTDAAILSTLTDGVVLVAMSGKSSIQLIKRFKQRLSTIGARIYGVVLNGIKPDSFEYGYYGYGYEYSYYDDNDDTTPKLEEDIKVQSANTRG